MSPELASKCLIAARNGSLAERPRDARTSCWGAPRASRLIRLRQLRKDRNRSLPIRWIARLEGWTLARLRPLTSFVLREPQGRRPSKSVAADFDTLRLPKSGKRGFGRAALLGARSIVWKHRSVGKANGSRLSAGSMTGSACHQSGVWWARRERARLCAHLQVIPDDQNAL